MEDKPYKLVADSGCIAIGTTKLRAWLAVLDLSKKSLLGQSFLKLWRAWRWLHARYGSRDALIIPKWKVRRGVG